MTRNEAARLKVGDRLKRQLTEGISASNWRGAAVYRPSPEKIYLEGTLVYQLKEQLNRVRRAKGQHGKSTAQSFVDVQSGAHIEGRWIGTIAHDIQVQEQKAA